MTQRLKKNSEERPSKFGNLHLIFIRSTPHPVTVTTRIITFLVGNPYKPSFATVTGPGVDPIYMTLIFQIPCEDRCLNPQTSPEARPLGGPNTYKPKV